MEVKLENEKNNITSGITLNSSKEEKMTLTLGNDVAIKYLDFSGDYDDLTNKPSIEGVELIKDKSFEDLGANYLTNLEIENILNNQI